jgi:hypothetical protein
MEIKQEVADETVYHDALDSSMDEEEDEIIDGGGGGEDEENDADNDQESPAGQFSGCVTSKIL